MRACVRERDPSRYLIAVPWALHHSLSTYGNTGLSQFLSQNDGSQILQTTSAQEEAQRTERKAKPYDSIGQKTKTKGRQQVIYEGRKRKDEKR